MSYLPFLSSRFPVGFGGWRDLLKCTRLDLTAILISKRNITIMLILPERHSIQKVCISLPFMLQAGHLFDVICITRIPQTDTY